MFLAIDQGGQSTRAVLFGPGGVRLGSSSIPVSESRPAPGFVEQDPEELLDSVRFAVRMLLGRCSAQVDPAALQAGLATQRASIVCWDRATGRPLTPVLSWQDTRCEKLLEPFASMAMEIQTRTGLRLSPHYAQALIRPPLRQPSIYSVFSGLISHQADHCDLHGKNSLFCLRRVCRIRKYSSYAGSNGVASDFIFTCLLIGVCAISAKSR